ncbi:hypothetical protein E4U41_007758 [Claviceps citrina]|nr:hypothetical protein E4U41_007758 [Claviceps citrina]
MRSSMTDRALLKDDQSIDRKKRLTEDPSHDLQGDEGYCDDSDEFAFPEAVGGHDDLIRSRADDARNSGVLKYGTSTEAALTCPQVVHRPRRMRIRRQRKHQLRLRTSSTVGICGHDSQIALDGTVTENSSVHE